jgi:hypothetical protein
MVFFTDDTLFLVSALHLGRTFCIFRTFRMVHEPIRWCLNKPPQIYNDLTGMVNGENVIRADGYEG